MIEVDEVVVNNNVLVCFSLFTKELIVFLIVNIYSKHFLSALPHKIIEILVDFSSQKRLEGTRRILPVLFVQYKEDAHRDGEILA